MRNKIITILTILATISAFINLGLWQDNEFRRQAVADMKLEVGRTSQRMQSAEQHIAELRNVVQQLVQIAHGHQPPPKPDATTKPEAIDAAKP